MLTSIEQRPAAEIAAKSLREYVQVHGVVQSKELEGKNEATEKYAGYFD